MPPTAVPCFQGNTCTTLDAHMGSKQAVFVIPLVIMSYSGGNCLGTQWQCFARSRGSQVWHMKSLVTLHSFPRWYKSMTALHVFTLCSFLKCQPANSGTCELLTAFIPHQTIRRSFHFTFTILHTPLSPDVTIRVLYISQTLIMNYFVYGYWQRQSVCLHLQHFLLISHTINKRSENETVSINPR